MVGEASAVTRSSDMKAAVDSGERAIARSTSRQMTLPEPSHTPFSGLWRNRRGIGDSSTKPLPPKHSRASAACIGARLQIQYLRIGVASRVSSRAVSSLRCESLPPAVASNRPASHIADVVAASDSRARSASTCVISG